MNLIDADKLIEHLGEKHTGHVGDYRMRTAIEAAKVDIGQIIRREIAEALQDVGRLADASDGRIHKGVMYFVAAKLKDADKLDTPSAEPVAPKLNPCMRCGSVPLLFDDGSVSCRRYGCPVGQATATEWNLHNPIKPEPRRYKPGQRFRHLGHCIYRSYMRSDFTVGIISEIGFAEQHGISCNLDEGTFTAEDLFGSYIKNWEPIE